MSNPISVVLIKVNETKRKIIYDEIKTNYIGSLYLTKVGLTAEFGEYPNAIKVEISPVEAQSSNE